ncbi:MAG TPA: M56 family metallopeptidase, partial [Candidatus Polarisedimenticolaceae bacterium]|nr:M56 family metallopeptidase [Candidatus Polarisedimenticolaceae bacterium]
ETDALLAHELAHLLRRDHWVRYVELSATALFWWHPVAWWARARLRRAEESCCDQIVLRTFADPRAYARALIETVEYLVDTGRPVPALASGVGEARQMEERLTMIMNERPPSRPSRTVRLVLAVVALALLLVFPTWSDRAAAAGEGRAPVGSPIDENESELRESMLELERLALDLERQLREIRGRQNELNLELERHRVARGIDELESGAESIDDGSREARERLLFERLDQIERQTSLTARALELERAELEQTAELELALRRRMLDVERSQGAGDRRAAERMAAAALELERRIESSARELDERRLQLQQEELDAQAEAMRAEIDLLREQGRRIEADELERELDRRWVIESERRGAGRVEERARVEAALAELTELARRLEREGRERELREVEKQIETLRRQIEAGSGEPY